MERMRRTWENPTIEAQQFVPQEYCVVCFHYEAQLLCNIANSASGPSGTDSSGMTHQKASCGTSYVIVEFTDGDVNISGYESYNYDDGIHDGAEVDVHDVVIPGITNEGVGVGTRLEGSTWQSTFRNQTWYHNGPAVITAYVLEDPSRPNHS